MENLALKIDRSLTIIEGGVDWESFFDTYWLKKPVLYKNPFKKPVMDQQVIFEILKRYQADLAKNSKRKIIFYDKDRSSINGSHTSKRNNLGVHKLLPDSTTPNLEQYVKKLMNIGSYEEFCIYIQDANSDDVVWKITRNLLRPLFEHIPLPPNKVTCDLFIGNYSKTNFGAHKDPVDNLMFMLFGKRTMLLWDDQTWKEKLGNPDDNSHIVLDYERFRDAAIACTLHPGDLLYWPSSHWHVGENNRQLSGSYNIDFSASEQDILADYIMKESLAESIKRIGRELFRDHGNIMENHTGKNTEIWLPQSYRDMADLFIRSLSSKKIEVDLTSWWLKKNSSYGQLSPIPKRKGNIQLSTLLRTDPQYPILYAFVESTILISHGGHVLFIPSAAETFRKIIDKLNQQSTFTPESFLKESGIPSVPEDTLLHLMIELYSIHAIDIVKS